VNKQAFLEHLRETAEILKPYINPPSPGAKHWNGTAYVESEPGLFEAGARLFAMGLDEIPTRTPLPKSRHPRPPVFFR
jgi:hypothetical protein